MTNEKAIDIIKCLAWHTRPNEEDIEQAIKALEQEPIIDEIRAEMKSYTDPKGFIVICENRFNMILDRCKAEVEPQESE